MSTFTNVSGEDLDLYVDGHPFPVDAGQTVTVADEFDYQLAEQPAWQLVAPKSTPVVASTPEPVPASEGDN